MGKGETHKKYSMEQKLEVLRDKEENKLSNGELSLKYGINKTSIREWVNAYETGGTEALSMRIPGKQNNTYTPDFRLMVTQEKLSGNFTYSELAKKYGMNKCVIQMWVRKYNENGEDALRSDERGRAPKSNYPQAKVTKKNKKELAKEVYDELLHLRAEVAYLKKLNALAWEKEQLAKRKKLR